MIFDLPLNDRGAGAVNTTPRIAKGSAAATFTRATVAWTKLASGLWAQVATGVARSCYLGADTAVGAYGGYFAEAAGTQLVTPTASIRDMTDASWAVVTMTKAKTATGIDGVGNSSSTLTATGANSTALQTLTAAASSRTYSAFVRRKTGTGTVFIQQGATQVDITALINSSTYTRVSVTASVLNVPFGFQINTSGDAIDVDFNQFEAGALATSPMASAGAARNADILTYAAIGNASQSAGTLYAEFSVVSDSSASIFPGILSIDDATVNERITLYTRTIDDTGRFIIVDGGVAQADLALGSITYASVGKIAGTYALNNFTGSLNGAAVVSDTSGTLPTTTQIGIGLMGGSANPLGGTVRNVRIYGSALSNAQLQSLTT